jgi:NAD(P)-dependent dehydrogenase (short-subunit alcohol dehydrogenase family)
MTSARNVVVTGASRGIGLATARRFASEGWRVFSASRQAPPPFTEAPERFIHIACDLADAAERARFITEVLRGLGSAPLHALINNAGVSPKDPAKRRLGVLHGDIATWHAVFALNFFAPLELARGFAAKLGEARGAIVNITSIAGHRVHPFAGSAYASSKAALSALTREMAAEFGPLGVRCNAVAPGEIKTEMISADYEILVPRIPLRRMGTSDEVASVLVKLCGEDFAYANGAEIFLTGGQELP